MKSVIGGLVVGFGAYYLFDYVMKNLFTGIPFLGEEPAAFGHLYELRDGLKNATDSYTNTTKRINDLDLKLTKANVEFDASDASRKPTVLFKIAEIQRQRDQAVLEAELLIRNVINPLREKLVTEEARLKSAVIAPKIALNRSGSIPSF